MNALSALLFLEGLLTAYLMLRKFAYSGSTSTDTRNRTEILPTLYIYQLNPKTMEQDKVFELNDIIMNEDGYTISGSNSREGMLRLSGRYQESRWVSTNHATVYKDQDDYFIRDNKSDNGMKRPGEAARVDLIRIENGMVVYLGLQPIQFIFVDNTGKGLSDAQKDAPIHGNRVNVREKPQRRNSPRSDR